MKNCFTPNEQLPRESLINTLHVSHLTIVRYSNLYEDSSSNILSTKPILEIYCAGVKTDIFLCLLKDKYTQQKLNLNLKYCAVLIFR